MGSIKKPDFLTRFFCLLSENNGSVNNQGRKEGIFLKVIVSEKLKEKRLRRIMGDDYDKKPKLRNVLERLEGVISVAEMDNGRSVEWHTLETERERKIACVYFDEGIKCLERYNKIEKELRERGEID